MNSTNKALSITKLKNVGNIWELGEGTFLVKLIDVVINPENIM